MNELLATFIFFFAVIDPIGTVPVFISVTSHYEEKIKRKIAFQATFVSAIILIFFVAAGEIILNAINIPLSAFQIAGGIILFLFALTMIFGESKPEEEIKMAANANETAIFPLAVPSIASPGAILAAVLMTENNRYNLFEQVQTSLMILAVLLVVLVLMLLATWVHRFIGNGGASIVSRVMGMILAAMAVSNVLAGIKEYFAI
ncbi:MarC family protein [Hydrogenovibrio sp. JE_KL2]|uniref:MarC family protein n=1 Tax=Hydrogenovibrio sp. JE_KL2 TaxID=2651188 RepID=UPI00128B5800|nr:MarC family protein [Hydrogenovibrio sp. JE_KL2]MPQ76143.1 MarC family protein [Hydrogenovibrio sp. JE_KL2]